MPNDVTLAVDCWSQAETGGHIVFVIACTKPPNIQWSTQRRYREFRILYEKLRNEGPAKALKAKGQLVIPFPAKQFGTLSTQELESRRQLLQSFLQLTLGLYATNVLSEETSTLFRGFIQLDIIEQVGSLETAHEPPGFPTEEEEVGDGINSRRRTLLEKKFQAGKISEAELNSLLQKEVLAEKLTSESALHERNSSRRNNPCEVASLTPKKAKPRTAASPTAARASMVSTPPRTSPTTTSVRSELASLVQVQEAELEARSKAMAILQVHLPHAPLHPPRPRCTHPLSRSLF
jgi:hypothetical protein